MRLLVLDDDRPEMDFVWRAQQTGHEVRWYVRPTERNKRIGEGMVKRVANWRDWTRWADLIVLTSNTNFLRETDAWRRNNPTALVVGATQESAAWELDRTLGMKIFQRHGIAIPPYREFSDYDSAIAYVKREGRAFVSKPCGDEPDKSLSYVAKSPADLVFMLERWKKGHKHKDSFILQEKVDGCEMAVGGWFGPGGFSSGWCENWEFKKLYAGDLGVATGEQGTVLRYVKKSRLADKVLKPLAASLEKTGYCGYVDVNCIIDDDGQPWPLEFTMRFGYPTLSIQRPLHQGDMVEWLACLSEGRDARPQDLLLNKIACGVVLSIPDYPYSHATAKDVTGIPIYGLTPSLLEKVAPLEVMMGEAPQDADGKVVTAPCLVTAGDYVLVATGLGDSVRGARRGAYAALDRIEIPNSPSWRIDIGQRLSRQLPAIQKHGYATDLIY